MRQLASLWLGCLALWLVLAGGGWLLLGEAAMVDASIACALCRVPMTATMAWFARSLGADAAPEQQLLAVLGGTVVRMFVVLAGGIGLFRAVPELHRPAFLLWVIVFYLATLTLEIALVVRRQNQQAAESAGRAQPPQG